MADLFKTTVQVTSLAANTSVTASHGLNSEGSGLKPTKIVPDEATRVKVTAVTTSGITFKNVGPATESAKFYVEYDEAMEDAGVYSWHTGFSREDQCRLIFTENAATKSATAVHASLAASAAVAFPGAFTNPVEPRNLSCVAAAGWDAGIVTIVGTNQWDEAVSEAITPTPGGTVYGVKIFKTVTSATKAAVGLSGDGCSIGTGDKLGVVADLTEARGVLLCDDVVDAVTVDATYDAFTPITLPDGARDYKLIANVA